MVPEAAMKAFLHLATVEDLTRSCAWLLQIAFNEARMHPRHAGTQLFESIDEVDDNHDSNLVAGQSIAIVAIEKSENRICIKKNQSSVDQIVSVVMQTQATSQASTLAAHIWARVFMPRRFAYSNRSSSLLRSPSLTPA